VKAKNADVTVLTPSLGYGRFIEDNILSVLAQEAVSIQHVVCDGGSVDETVDVLRRYEHALEWISEPDRGQSDALNKALAKAEGRWVAWLNADEFYLPRGLAELVDRGDATSADVVFGDNVFVDEAGSMTRLLPQHPFSFSILRMFGCYIASSSTIFRRSALPAEPWDRSIRLMMDWDLYLRLASRHARFEKVNYPVGAFRRHPGQVTARHAEDFRDEHVKLFARYGISSSGRRWGRWLHGAYKLWSGAYRRQMRARQFHGVSLLWHRDEAARSSFDALLESCYLRRASGRAG
jgi:glycosyltransferase involved in cell wall biosynthesis